MFDVEGEEGDNFRVDYDADIIEHSVKTLYFGLYSKLNQFERHFDNITNKYKNIALTWLLATFAGIGFLLSTESVGLPFDHMLAVSIISFLGFLGISLIWQLDVNIYSKFWSAIFIEEVVMEKKFDFLLSSKNIDLLIDDDRERIFSHGILYIISNTILIITMCASLAIFIKNYGFVLEAIIIFCISIFLIFLIFFMISCSKKTRDSFNALLKERLNAK